MQKIVIPAFFVFAIAFVSTLGWRPYPGDFIIKAVPIAGLAVLAFVDIPGFKGKMMTLAFACSAVGDIILEMDPAAYFVFGLGAFLVAHLFFVAAFAGRPWFGGYRGGVALGILLYCVGLGAVLAPHLGDLTIPVALYIAVITTMGIAAALGAANHTLVVIGAVLFIASDSMIAVNRFLAPLPAASVLIMTTYYGGQVLIALGATKTPPRAHARTTP